MEGAKQHTGEILSRAGKATGTHTNGYNLKYTEPKEIAGTTGSVDVGQVDNSSGGSV